MKVHLIKKQSIENYVLKNAQARIGFAYWLSIIKNVDWLKAQDMIETFNSADLLGDGIERVIFNIGGNKYRLICSYYFGEQQVHLFVKWIGTHAEYDELCKKNKQFTIDQYSKR